MTIRTRSTMPVLRVFVLLVPSILVLVVLELILGVTESRWSGSAGLAPDFVLDRQGGLFEIQRRIAEEAGTAAGKVLASERMYRWDRDLFWRLHPNLDLPARNYLVPKEWGDPPTFPIRTNAAGMREEESWREGSAVRILCMGNSCTFGWGIARDETYTAQLDALFAARPVGFDVDARNAGIPGYTSHQGLLFYRSDLASFESDVVIISFGFNDSRLATQSDEVIQIARSSFGGRLGAYAGRLRIYRFLESLFLKGKSAVNEAGRTPRVSIENYEQNLRNLISDVRAGGAEPVLLALVMPPEYRDAMTRVSVEQDVVLVDPMPVVASLVKVFADGETPPGFENLAVPPYDPDADPRTALFADPIHPNPAGNYVIAARIYQQLIEQGVLERAYPDS